MNNLSILNNVLPEEIINKNEDIVRKCVNGTKKSNELILMFELNETATNVDDKLMKWLFKCLDTISDKVLRWKQYEWNIISQIKDNDYQDEESEKKNTIMIAIHITDDSWMSFNNNELTIPYNYSPSTQLAPQEIMDCLMQVPIFIKKIGVSAVSSEVMMQWWRDMISTEPNCFDIAGKGYMVHPMWKKWAGQSENSEWGNWSDVREQSFNFGWKGYIVDE